MKKYYFILGLLIASASIFGFIDGGNNHEIIISLSKADYASYLKDHAPLDRLFIKGDKVHLLVGKEERRSIESLGLDCQLFAAKSMAPTAETQGGINGAYHTYKETEDFLTSLANRFPDLARLEIAGQSIEGRNLYILRISNQNTYNADKPQIFIAGCHHAREWISVEVPLLFAEYLLEHYGDDPLVQGAVNNVEINIMPLVNPDGLEYSIRTYRWWRKNRRYNGSLTFGVDPNRNYGYMWGYDDSGSSPNPWSNVYRGTAPFSEPETTAVRNFLLTNPPAGAISYHNYSQIILYPWGYTDEPAPDSAVFESIAKGMSDRMLAVNGNLYEYGNNDILYNTNGDTVDWIYGTFGVPAFTIELPPDEYINGGFMTTEEMIQTAFSENLAALLYFVNYFVK